MSIDRSYGNEEMDRLAGEERSWQPAGWSPEEEEEFFEMMEDLHAEEEEGEEE